jgi:fimbrial chaperone protein
MRDRSRPLARRRLAAIATLLLTVVIGALIFASTIGVAQAQGLTVQPVTIQLALGQMAAAVTVINQSDSETSFQIRAFAWSQPGGDDRLTGTDEMLASSPLGTVAANATQVVRIVLRHPPQGQEASYRIILDQIPPPAAPGTVRIALRLSIPIFAEPASRVVPHCQWRIEGSGRQAFLVAVNDGSRHATIRDIALTSPGGSAKVDANVSPYVLVGATRRWRILTSGILPSLGATVRLTAQADAGAIDQPVTVVAGP